MIRTVFPRGFCLFLLLLLYSIKSLFNNIPGWTRTCCVVQANSNLVVLLSLPPLCWNYMCELPQLAWSCIKLWPPSPACFPACTWPHPASHMSSYPQAFFLAQGLTLLIPWGLDDLLQVKQEQTLYSREFALSLSHIFHLQHTAFCVVA